MVSKIGILDILRSDLGCWGVEVLCTSIGLVIIDIISGSVTV